MTKLSNTHSMIKVGDTMIPINKVVFLDTGCEAFFVTNDETGVRMFILTFHLKLLVEFTLFVRWVRLWVKKSD